jgi:predicted molibdopterin-dependent oxidoreductase YjgC
MFRKLVDPQESTVTVFIDGAPAEAAEGETVAAVLLRQASPWSRTTPLSQARRAPYCMMGVCFDCLAVVDGIASVQSCLTLVRDGMRIERQLGPRQLVAKDVAA